MNSTSPTSSASDGSFEPPIAASPAASVREPISVRHERKRFVDDEDGRSAFLPVVLLGTAVLAWLAFQCWQLVSERGQLQQTRTAQEQLVQNSTNFRARLDKVARDTQLLADNGNENARVIVDELRKRGITINTNAAPAGASLSSEAQNKK